MIWFSSTEFYIKKWILKNDFMSEVARHSKLFGKTSMESKAQTTAQMFGGPVLSVYWKLSVDYFLFMETFSVHLRYDCR